MIYRDYSRAEGEWIPNQYGGRENLEAIEFLKHTNWKIHSEVSGAISIAEESTSFGGVTHPTENGGLGFNFKWNMGWMNDTLSYMKLDPVYRRYHHDKMTFGTNLRAYYGYMWGYPGKKLLFMGNEFAQGREWNYEESLDWFLLDENHGGLWHKGVLQLVKDLNGIYQKNAPLFELDGEPEGFDWLVVLNVKAVMVNALS